MFAFDNFEIGALYLIQDFMRTPKLTDFLESMTDLGNAAGSRHRPHLHEEIQEGRVCHFSIPGNEPHPDERHPEAYFQKGPPL